MDQQSWQLASMRTVTMTTDSVDVCFSHPDRQGKKTSCHACDSFPVLTLC